ncbi:MAG: AraC family transcriptional regulator [Methyloceanibacter sp.]
MSATAIVSTAGFNGRKAPRHAAFQLLGGGLKGSDRFDKEVVDRKVPDAFGPRIRLNKATSLRGGPPLDRPLLRITITSAESVKRSGVTWPGMGAEIVQITTSERLEISFKASATHMLVFYQRGARRSGETKLEGLPSSMLHDLARKLVFVPAGHEFVDVHESRVPAQIAFFYFDEADHAHRIGGEVEGMQLEPRLFFEDAALLATAEKLTYAVEDSDADGSAYCQALGLVLAHELARSRAAGAEKKAAIRGGLASWQQRTVTSYIEEHLAEPIMLATLAELAGLSTYHFCRAFKQSFGVPPHRYHTRRRIEQGKIMLAKRIHSVTDIGLALGFSETSSFTAAFRKATGLTPTGYHRSLA